MFFYQYKTKQTSDNFILENFGTLESVPDCCKNQKMCNKTVDNYVHALEIYLDCFKTHKMHNKADDTYLSAI